MKTLRYLDAYAHVGEPRFGNLAQAVRVFNRSRIEKSVLVMGPGVPDCTPFLEVAADRSDRFRWIGIPFGNTPERRAEFAELMLRAGAIGIRIDCKEARENPEVLGRIGQAGGWIFALDPIQDESLTTIYRQWLDTYPEGRIAAPHFFKAAFVPPQGQSLKSMAALLEHPRFHVILSRQGDMGSKEPYPHRDFLPWLNFLKAHVGWGRLLWGSEYPVYYWRNETMPDVQMWFADLELADSRKQLELFYGRNTERLFFEQRPPHSHTVHIPSWVDELFVRERKVPLLKALELPGSVYLKLLTELQQSQEENPDIRLKDFLEQVLKERYNDGSAKE